MLKRFLSIILILVITSSLWVAVDLSKIVVSASYGDASPLITVRTQIKNENFERIPTGTEPSNNGGTALYEATATHSEYMSYWRYVATGGTQKIITMTNERVESTQVLEIYANGGSPFSSLWRRSHNANDKPLTDNIVFDLKFFMPIDNLNIGRVQYTISNPSSWGLLQLQANGSLTTGTVNLFYGEASSITVNATKGVWHRIQIQLDTTNENDKKCLAAYLDGMEIAGAMGKSLTNANLTQMSTNPNTMSIGYNVYNSTADLPLRMLIDDMQIYEPDIEPIILPTSIVLHVSTSGSDSNPGTAELPLATLNGARIKAAVYAGKVPITVKFHAGEYKFLSKVSFGQSDSGTEAAPIIYEAAEGEKVTFSSGKTLDLSKFAPVTDAGIIARFPDIAKNKIRQLNLNEQGITNISAFVPSTSRDSANGEYVAFYLNDKEQPIAQWPNGDDNYALWKRVISIGSADTFESNGVGGVIEYREENPSRWNDATDFYIGGYPGFDYRYEGILVAGVDPNTKTLTMKYGSNFGFVNRETTRWKAFNLLEEIDMPGEWYVDRSTMMLYYYVPDNISNLKFEIVNNKEPFINMTQTKFVTIRGINFTKTRGNAILMNKLIKNITIENCIFSFIGQNAITLTGTTRGPIISYYDNIIDAGSNCVIKDNTFQFLGSGAVELWGGNRDTLEKGNNIISNNYIFMGGMTTKNTPLINIFGVGNTVEHNLIHNSPFHAINYSGVDHVIKYNEIYNVNRESYDAGAIYTWRDLITRGNEVSYNLIHDYLSKDPIISNDAPAIYLDEQHSGANVHHNVLVGGSAGIQLGGGQDNTINSNTVINVKYNVVNSIKWPANPSLLEILNKALNIPIYLQRFPEMLETAKDVGLVRGNIITNNLSDKALTVSNEISQNGTVQDNLTIEDFFVFVNPTALDYRVKNSSIIKTQLPDILSESFDLGQIGIQPSQFAKTFNNPNATSSPFMLLYPQNNSTGVKPSGTIFEWENALFADKYRVMIATNPNITNVVFDKETYFNHINITGLQASGTTYYWTVKAINTSRTTPSTWNCSGSPLKFTTSEYSDIYSPVGVGGSSLITLKTLLKNDDFELIPDGIDPSTNTSLYNATAGMPELMTSWRVPNNGATQKVIVTMNRFGASTKALELYETAGNSYSSFMRKAYLLREPTLTDSVVFDMEFLMPSDSKGGKIQFNLNNPSEWILMQINNGTIDLFCSEAYPINGIVASRDNWHRIQIYIDTSNESAKKCVAAYLDGILIPNTTNKSLTNVNLNKLSTTGDTLNFLFNSFGGTAAAPHRVLLDNIMVYEPGMESLDQYAYPFSSGRLILTNNGSEEVTDLSSIKGQPLTVTTTITNRNSPIHTDYKVIFALYSVDNKLLELKINLGDLSMSNSETISNTLNIPVNATSDLKVRGFIWNSNVSIMPLALKITN